MFYQICFIRLVIYFQVSYFGDSIALYITPSTHTFRWSKQPEPYVKAYKFLWKSDRYSSPKIFILDISGKPYLSGLAISRLLILLFQHQHINIHIRTLDILCVQLISPIIRPQIKNSIIYPLYTAHDTRFVSACGGPPPMMSIWTGRITWPVYCERWPHRGHIDQYTKSSGPPAR